MKGKAISCSCLQSVKSSQSAIGIGRVIHAILQMLKFVQGRYAFSGYIFLSYCCLNFSIIEFADNDDSIGEMSLLWRKKCAEPCSKCNESTDTNLTCDFCDKVRIV